MNRCTTQFFLGALFVLAASTGLAPLAASAQSADFKPAVRQFPKAARRGEMVVLAPPSITLDGKADRLSVGSRIHGANNLLVMSGALVNQTLVVNYTRESAGNVHEVWILNSEEIRQKRPGARTSWFSLDDSTDTAASAKTP